MRKRLYLALFLLCLAPSVVLADGVSPVLNLFHKETWLPATIVTLVIIFVESALLRWRIKEVRYPSTLWRSAAINAASSLAGSVLLLGLGRVSFFIWDTMSLVIPLFIITLLTEIPLLHLLYKQVPVSWARACVLGFGINIASYAVVFVVEIGLLIGWLAYAGHLDQKEMVEWKHPELLARSTGLIYATEETRNREHGLRVFDLQTALWHSLTNCPALDPNKWDVAGRVFAFVSRPSDNSQERPIMIASLPDFATLHKISLSPFADVQNDKPGNWQGVADLSLSPDAKKLAVLYRVADAVAYRDDSSHYDLGDKCKMIVIAVESGQEIARASRWASGGDLCWFPDSSAVLFLSLRDEALYKTTEAEVRGDISYGTGYAKEGKFSKELFSFNLNTGEIRRFADGYSPELSGDSGQIAVREADAIRILDVRGKEQACVHIPRLGYSSAALSPDGKLILATIRPNISFRFGGRLTVVDLSQPGLRHILADEFAGKYKWISAEKESSANGAPSVR